MQIRQAPTICNIMSKEFFQNLKYSPSYWELFDFECGRPFRGISRLSAGSQRKIILLLLVEIKDKYVKTYPRQQYSCKLHKFVQLTLS